MDMPELRTRSASRVGANELTYDAMLRNLELLGEAAAHVPGLVQAAQPETPWHLIVATRNHLIHGYLGIDDDPVWWSPPRARDRTSCTWVFPDGVALCHAGAGHRVTGMQPRAPVVWGLGSVGREVPGLRKVSVRCL